MTYLLLIALSPIIAALLFKLFLSRQSSEKIMKKYEGQKVSKLVKKYPEADVGKFRLTFLQIGLLLSLCFVLYAFNVKQQTETATIDYTVNVEPPTEVLPPRTPPPSEPPPPPPPPPKLEILEDEIEIEEEQPEISETDVNEDTQVEPIDLPIEDDIDDLLADVDEPDEQVPEEPEIFDVVEDMPEFPGGQAALFRFFGEQVKYPTMARENGIEGTVYIGFVVMEDGSIGNVQIKRGLNAGGAGCDAEALRVTKLMPRWTPGRQRGKTVRVNYTIPVKFTLN